jgi:hypothetical protein
MSQSPPIETQASTVLYCSNHPEVETTLRCNRCEKPICPRCAVPTPTGYRCKECVRGQQRIFETAEWVDYPVAMLIAALVSGVGSFIASFLGFFTLFLAPAAGMLVAEAVRLGVRRRRSTRLFQLTAAGAVLGGLPMFLLSLFSGSLIGIGVQAFYLFAVATTAYQRLKGINLR